jgi:hypothetical protein
VVRDIPALAGRRFSGSTFDWQVQRVGHGPDNGLAAAAGKAICVGIGATRYAHQGHVSVYVEVGDPTAYIKKTDQPRHQAIVVPTEIPRFGLDFAFFTDPEGHLTGPSAL